MRRELVIFLIVGLLTVVIDCTVYFILLGAVGLTTTVAKTTGFLLGTIFAYVANRRFTFKQPGLFSVRSLLMFSGWYFVTLLTNVGANALLLKVFSTITWSVWLSFFLATGISAILNFIGMKYLIFNKRLSDKSIGDSR
jgi:putative flippase GtrA